jgi:hypothetical protein
VVSGVIDTADHKKIDFLVEYLREYEKICKKALTRRSGAQKELFDEKNRRSKISWQGPFKEIVTRAWGIIGELCDQFHKLEKNVQYCKCN